MPIVAFNTAYKTQVSAGADNLVIEQDDSMGGESDAVFVPWELVPLFLAAIDKAVRQHNAAVASSMEP